jgi:hypothetical protein
MQGLKRDLSKIFELLPKHLKFIAEPRILPAHATMLVKDSLDWTFSLPQDGHFALIRGS